MSPELNRSNVAIINCMPHNRGAPIIVEVNVVFSLRINGHHSRNRGINLSMRLRTSCAEGGGANENGRPSGPPKS
jgi:hypothetical protein